MTFTEWKKVTSMQRPGTEAIRTQIQFPKRETSKITNSQNTENICSTECAALSQEGQSATQTELKII